MAVLVAFALLGSGCGPDVAPAWSSELFYRKLRERGIELSATQRRAVNHLASRFDDRPDLQRTFGDGDALDLRSMLQWGVDTREPGHDLDRWRTTLWEIIRVWDGEPAAAGNTAETPSDGPADSPDQAAPG